jgi:hypothetical protein
VVVEDVVVAVRVEVCAAALLIETEVGDRLQVAGLAAPAGELVTEQVRETVPVNELDGVTVMVEVLPLVAPGLTAMLPLLERVKLLLPLGGSQKPEQPEINPAMSGTATNTCRVHLLVIIASPQRSSASFAGRSHTHRCRARTAICAVS